MTGRVSWRNWEKLSSILINRFCIDWSGKATTVFELRFRPYVVPEEFENTASCIISTARPTVHRHENEACRKRSSNQRYFKNTGFASQSGWKTFWKRSSVRNRCHHNNHIWFPFRNFPPTQIQNGGWILRFQLSPVHCVDGKHLMRFQSELKRLFQISLV